MMYVVLTTSKDVDMMNSLRDALKEEFPLIQFTVRNPLNKEYHLRLEGNANDDAPRKFVKDYIAEYNARDNTEIKRKPGRPKKDGSKIDDALTIKSMISSSAIDDLL